ncbi:MAG: hypothetical protein GC179_26250 [Anaerolineaceae bacterium]|nr:hypothetical protein [Anaerolineaceae bacterium]
MSSEMDYKAINERVEKQVRREKNLTKFILFATNLGLYVMFLFIAWQMYLANGGTPPRLEEMVNIPGIARFGGNPTTSALVMLSVGWAVALLLQVVGFIIDLPIGERSIRDRATGREMRREMTRLGLASLEEQEKRKGMMRLTDDGELEDVDDVVEEALQIQQNRKG